MTVGEKIKSARQRASLKQKELAERLGVTYVNISQWESGRRKPKFETLQRIADVLNISVFELVDDIEIETKIDSSNIRNLHEINDPNELKKIIVQQSLGSISDKMKLLKNDIASLTEKTKKHGVKIPVLGTVTTGLPASTIENILAYEEITPELAETGEFFALRIQGDSMEPRIKDGDIIVVKVQSDVESGEIAVVITGGNTVTVKKVIKQAEGIVLQAYNPAYESLFFATQNNEDSAVQIIGRVIELRAQL